MGNFRIVIDAVGNHGQDREKKDGEVVDFGTNTPEAKAKKFVEELQGSCGQVTAKVIHWPNTTEGPLDFSGNECITDDLITGVRKGSF